MTREARTLEAMIRIYCRGHHATRGKSLCTECADLQAYAGLRLEKCPFQEAKTTCAKCPVHCYRPEMRVRVRQVMRYAGPRMLFRHPILALLHLVVDGKRALPVRPIRKPDTA